MTRFTAIYNGMRWEAKQECQTCHDMVCIVNRQKKISFYEIPFSVHLLQYKNLARVLFAFSPFYFHWTLRQDGYCSHHHICIRFAFLDDTTNATILTKLIDFTQFSLECSAWPLARLFLRKGRTIAKGMSFCYYMWQCRCGKQNLRLVESVHGR